MVVISFDKIKHKEGGPSYVYDQSSQVPFCSEVGHNDELICMHPPHVVSPEALCFLPARASVRSCVPNIVNSQLDQDEFPPNLQTYSTDAFGQR